MATLMFYVGFYHFLIYRRQRDNRENLTFALSCFSVGLYAICCAGLYNVSSPAVGVEWQRLQVITLAVLATTLLWFIADYTGHTNSKVVKGFTFYYLFAVLAGLLIRSDLTWTSVVSIKETRLPFGYDIRYNEMAPGILTNFQSLVGVIYFIYIITVSLKFYRSGNKEKGLPLLVAISILFVGSTSDTLVSSGFYDFIYILEYSYIGMILVFTFFLTNKVIKAGETKASLLESEEKYRNIYTNAQVGLARTQISTGKVLTCNDKMAQIFNYENTEDFINEFIFSDNYVNPQLRVSLLNELKKTGVRNNVEAEFYGKDKSKVWARFDTRIFPDKGYMEDVVVDITERKIGEKALIESENRFRDISLSMADWIWETDSESKFTYISQSITEVLGYAPEELIGKTPFDLMPEDESVRVKKMISKIVSKSENIKDLENWNIDKSGNRLIMLTSGIPILDKEGKTRGYRGVNKNITSQRKLETQLQQAQKMESIGTLAGGIAHDFNNILFPIIGHTEMLLSDIPEDSPSKGSLNEIYSSSLRAKDLVKQILTFSRQESRELNLMKIQPIIKEALKLIRFTIPSTIEIKHDIQADCGVIKADPTQIHQIVMNLATNAYHAMEKTGGELKVSLKKVELGDYDLMTPNMTMGEYACLKVSDTGTGMDKVLTEKIFDPFFTTKAIGKGTGMGLSVIHGIVTNMGGTINVYSEPGEGTEFKIYLPVEKNHVEKQVINSKAEIQLGTEHIMLVDDEEAILTMEKQMLERLGYQVTSRTSSIEALEAFRSNPDKFDLVITDMAMPNMPGDKLSEELTKIRPDIPILLCTGFSENMSEKKAASLGIKGFLLKPIVMRDLAQKLRVVLDECKI
ncbi:MAG: PAS domain S-box protein [Deltaproteobacteria bacterium]|nr:PAS domain S-box protein [Candidatus Desulfobacula maris]